MSNVLLIQLNIVQRNWSKASNIMSEWNAAFIMQTHQQLMNDTQIAYPHMHKLTLQCPQFESAECIEELTCMMSARFRRICTTWRIERWYEPAHFGGNILQKYCKRDKKKHRQQTIKTDDYKEPIMGDFTAFVFFRFYFQFCFMVLDCLGTIFRNGLKSFANIHLVIVNIRGFTPLLRLAIEYTT